MKLGFEAREPGFSASMLKQYSTLSLTVYALREFRDWLANAHSLSLFLFLCLSFSLSLCLYLSHTLIYTHTHSDIGIQKHNGKSVTKNEYYRTIQKKVFVVGTMTQRPVLRIESIPHFLTQFLCVKEYVQWGQLVEVLLQLVTKEYNKAQKPTQTPVYMLIPRVELGHCSLPEPIHDN